MGYRRKRGDKRGKEGDGGKRPFPTTDDRERIRPVNVSQTVYVYDTDLDGAGYALLISDHVIVGDPATDHVLITPGGGVEFKDADQSYTAVSQGVVRVGLEDGNHVRIDDDSVDIMDGETVRSRFGSTITIGETDGSHVKIDTNSVDIKVGSAKRTSITATAVYVGETSDKHVKIDDDSLDIKNGSTVLARFDEDIQIGENEYIYIDADGLKVQRGSTKKFLLDNDGDLFIGRNVDSASGVAVAVFTNSQTYNGEAVGSNDIMIGSNDGSQPNIYWDDSAGTWTVRRGTVDKILVKSTGTVKIGRDLSEPDKTFVNIFAASETYNGENFGAGDVLLFDNSTDQANIFWDKSTGRLNFRGGTTTTIYIDTDGTLKAGAFLIDEDGIALDGEGAYNDFNAFRLMGNGSKVGELSAWGSSDGAAVQLLAEAQENNSETALQLMAIHNNTSSGGFSEVSIRAEEENDSYYESAYIYMYRSEADSESYVEINPLLKTYKQMFHPTSWGDEAQIMMRGNKFIIQRNHAGGPYYYYFDLTASSDQQLIYNGTTLPT